MGLDHDKEQLNLLLLTKIHELHFVLNFVKYQRIQTFSFPHILIPAYCGVCVCVCMNVESTIVSAVSPDKQRVDRHRERETASQLPDR